MPPIDPAQADDLELRILMLEETIRWIFDHNDNVLHIPSPEEVEEIRRRAIRDLQKKRSRGPEYTDGP